MPFLDANALKSDPQGMAFLRAVIGKRQPWRASGALLAKAKSLPKPLQDYRGRDRGARPARFEVID
jgi:hypothetical protein